MMDPLATKTLAEIYLQQGHFQEAYDIFKILLEKNPNNTEIQEKLRELNERLSLSSSSLSRIPPKGERIRFLERWLSNIRDRRRTS